MGQTILEFTEVMEMGKVVAFVKLKDVLATGRLNYKVTGKTRRLIYKNHMNTTHLKLIQENDCFYSFKALMPI